MTLPSSGPLSLSDIQTEFGGSNPIGLNEYYAGGGLVPSGTTGTYGAVPTSGQISIQNFYGTSNVLGASANFASHIGYETPAGVLVRNSSSSTYYYCDYGNRFTGLTVSASSDAILNNADPSNAYYKKNIIRTSPSQHVIHYTPYPMAFDNNGYIVFSGYHENGNGGTPYQGYMRISANTTTVSVNTANYFPETSGSYQSTPPVVDSSGNVYCGVQISASNTYMAVCKITSGNAFSWASGIDIGNSFNRRTAPAIDSSGNIIVASNSGYIAKYNSAGTLQWQKQFSGFNPGYNIATDSSGNIYLSGTNGNTSLTTVKLDSSGAVQWSRVYSNAANFFTSSTAVAVDSSGNVYSVCTDNYTSNYRMYLLKYNSSGSLQWQRYWTHNAGNGGYTTFAFINGPYLQINHAPSSGGSVTRAYGTSGAYTSAPFGVPSFSDAAAGVTIATSSQATSTFSLSLTSFNNSITVGDISTPTWYNLGY